MEHIGLNELQSFVMLVVGMATFLYATFSESKTESLKLTSEKVEGIIFELEDKDNLGDLGTSIKDKVTVRFVTRKKEWITAEINQDFALFFDGQYKI